MKSLLVTAILFATLLGCRPIVAFGQAAAGQTYGSTAIQPQLGPPSSNNSAGANPSPPNLNFPGPTFPMQPTGSVDTAVQGGTPANSYNNPTGTGDTTGAGTPPAGTGATMNSNTPGAAANVMNGGTTAAMPLNGVNTISVDANGNIISVNGAITAGAFLPVTGVNVVGPATINPATGMPVGPINTTTFGPATGGTFGPQIPNQAMPANPKPLP